MNETSDFSTLVGAIRHQVSQDQDKIVFTFLADGEREQGRLTSRQADERARAIAAGLQAIAQVGDRAVLQYPQGLEFVVAFLGCLYAGVVPIPCGPIPPSGAPEMLLGIVDDAQPKLLLTTSAMRLELQAALAQFPTLRNLRLLATDTLQSESNADDWWQPKLSDNALAVLMYTSGSTRKARGIMMRHEPLVNFTRGSKERAKPDSLSVTWTPQYHGAGMASTTYIPLISTVPVVIMPPTAFMESPLRWLKAITRYKATSAGGPNFAYQFCVERTSPAERENLDLSSWQVASVSMEPIHRKTLEQFAQTFSPYGFRKEAFASFYGLSESSLYTAAVNPKSTMIKRSALEQDQVALALPEDAEAVAFVSCGAPTVASGLKIVDPVSLTFCQPDRVGEVWIDGKFAMAGYLNKPEETKATFNAYLADGTGPFLRTGDMGFLKDGELYITGRLKDMIIIRGKNHYAVDIEQIAGHAHPALMPGAAAAFGINLKDEEHLVIVHEVKPNVPNVNMDQVAKAVRQAIAREMQLPVQVVMLVKYGSLPRTAAGKIQHYVAREQFLASQGQALQA